MYHNIYWIFLQNRVYSLIKQSCSLEIIFRALIFESRLTIVTMLAKRLPVSLVPEQSLVSPVRLDMIDHGCSNQFSCSFTIGAKRVVCQESLPLHLPAMVVAAFKRASSFASMQGSVKLAILTACQTWTAGMFARTLGLHRHVRQPPLRKEKPSKSQLQGLSAVLRFSHDTILHPKNTSKRTSADILQIVLIQI